MKESNYKKKIEYNQRVHKLGCKDGKYYCRAVHGILDKSKHGLICGKGCPCFARFDDDGGIICEYYDLNVNITSCTPKQNKQRAQVLIDSKIAPLFPNVWLKQGSRKTEMEKAYVFVLKEYARRKIYKKPLYQMHLIDAANIIMQLSSDVNLLVAVILHDISAKEENQKGVFTSLEIIEKEFGENISEILKYDNEFYKKDCYDKEYTLEYVKLLKNAPVNVKLLRFADSLSHLKEYYKKLESKIEDTLNDTYYLHVDYYDKMKEVFEEFKDCSVYNEYLEYLDKISKR